MIYLRVGAANMTATVYVNGKRVDDHSGGYAAFAFDITSYVTPGEENLIAISVNNSASLNYAPLSGDFTFFGGITRDVKLLVCDPVHINPIRTVQNSYTRGKIQVTNPGVVIRQSDVSASSATLTIETDLRNAGAEPVEAVVEATIKDAEGNPVKTVSESREIAATDTASSKLITTLTDPHLWNGVADPYLYRVEVAVKVNGQTTDQSIQPLGIRFISVDPDKGFFLNGKSYPLRGIAFHEDKKDKGRALSDADRKETVDLLAETGANYFRLAHYQHGDYTYNYLDSLGIICWTEAPVVDCISAGDKLSQFRANAVQQLYELMYQQYNHPSVCFWGVCNEVTNHPTAGQQPVPFVEWMTAAIELVDTTRFSTLAANYENNENWIPDVFAMNRYQGWYGSTPENFASVMDNLHNNRPDNPVGVSEYGAGANTTQHEYPANQPTPTGHYHPEEYQNLYHEIYLKAINARPYLWGTSIWAGIDFASDSRNEGAQPGINDKGLITHDRKIKKDAYYWYKANWNAKDPVVYITSRRYTKRTSLTVPVKVYSNCEEITLTVNGEVVGKKTSEDRIFLLEEVQMKEGANTIEVSGVFNGETVTDAVTWECTAEAQSVYPAEPAPGEIQINFGTADTEEVEGYWKDSGAAFGDQGHEYQYGWRTDNTANGRDRNKLDDIRYDSFAQMGNAHQRTWSIELPNGDYAVSVACGDIDYIDSYNRVQVNDKVVINFAPGGATKFAVGTDTVSVTDGRLEVTTADNGTNAKINYIHISRVIPVGVDKATAASLDWQCDGTTLRIAYPDAAPRSYSLYDMSGKLLATGRSQKAEIEIPVKDLPSGNYVVKVADAQKGTSIKFYK